jgi:endonuclease-3 related protein
MRYLAGVCKFFLIRGGVEKITTEPTTALRTDLLELPGVGQETADSMLLYALEKPIFVIDEYTRRLAIKEQFACNLSYQELQTFFKNALPRQTALYQDLHALIVIEGKNALVPAKYSHKFAPNTRGVDARNVNFS